jgi:DNA topoisomerase-3
VTRGSRRGAASPPKRGADLDHLEQREPDPRIVEALRTWRLEEARRENVPAFCVMTNRALEGIARLRPTTEDDLLTVKGVGPRVVERWGRAILSIVNGGE